MPTTASPYFGSASRIVWPPARIAPAARTCRVGAVEDRAHHLVRQLLGQRRDREREQRHAAHREHVVERVRRGDRAEVVRVVDDRREEVDREDERTLVVEPVDRSVVRRVEADEQVLRLGRHEPAQQLLEPGRRVLRRAAAGRREVGQLHSPHRNATDGGRGAAVVRGEERGTAVRFACAAAMSFRLGTMPSALVTGGSSGIGLAIARMLRDEGFELTLASRTAEKIEAAAAELGAHAVAADIGKEEDCIRVVAEHRERFGGLDVLVNSAGIGIAGTVESLQTKHIDLQLGVNLRGLLLVTREAIPLLKEIARLDRQPRLDRRHDADARADGLRRDEGGGDRADALAERRARRRRRARDRDLPRLRRHADGRVVRARPRTR